MGIHATEIKSCTGVHEGHSTAAVQRLSSVQSVTALREACCMSCTPSLPNIYSCRLQNRGFSRDVILKATCTQMYSIMHLR